MTGEPPPDGRIRVRRDGPVWELVIDRPTKLNGFTPKMMRELAHAVTACDRDASARAMLIRAEGAHFTAGLDLARVSEAWSRGESIYPEGALDIWDLRPPIRSTPMILAVKGICFTVGVELSLAADVVIAADNCRFGQMEVRRGIMAAGGATIRMVRSAGWGNAMRYLLTGDEWDAETALRMGWVQQVVPAGVEEAVARDIARRIAENSAPLAVEATRQNARTALEEGSATAAAQFDAIRARLRLTADAEEGVRSFVERRPPRFSGH